RVIESAESPGSSEAPYLPDLRRRARAQRVRRTRERKARRRAVAASRLLRRHGVPMKTVAHGIGVSTRTLRRWNWKWDHDRLATKPRGRPPSPLPGWIRRDTIALLEVSGGDLGVPTLLYYFPEATRAALEDLKRRYRRIERRRSLIHVLYWRRPGAVWAAD